MPDSPAPRDWVTPAEGSEAHPSVHAVESALPDDAKRLASPTLLPTDAVLVTETRAGVSWAKEALFKRHARMANGLAFRLMGRDSEVDDLVQDSFLEAFSSLHRLQNPQAFASWLGTIVSRMAYRRLRRRKLLTRLGFLDAPDACLDQALARSVAPDVAADLGALYRALDELSELPRVVYLLRKLEGWTVEEVAERLKVSQKTVKRRFARAEEHLGSKGWGKQ